MIPIPDWSRITWLALTVVAADAVTKAVLVTPSWAMHHRSGEWTLEALCMTGAWVLLAAYPLVRLPAALIAAGTLGNFLSSLHGDVQNPIVLGNVAFNVADVSMATGVILVLALLPRVGVRVYRARRRLA